jgi:hypothetical protein
MKHLYLKNEFYITFFLYFKIEVFYFNQFLHNLSNQFFKNLILIRFEGIEANYLYIYQTNFSLKICYMIFFYIS